MGVAGSQLINIQGNGEKIQWGSSANDYGHNNLWGQFHVSHGDKN